MSHRLHLFVTGFAHVCMVALSTYLISHRQYLGVFVVGFFLSWVWAGNVKRVSIGSRIDQLLYAFGAAFGSLTGTLISSYL